MKKYFCLIILFLIIPMVAWCQLDSTDYFPLHIGNSWTYQYQNRTDYDEGYSTDSGIANYSILSCIKMSDSTIWTVKEARDIIYIYNDPWPGGSYASYSVKDSSIIQLTEYNMGNHKIKTDVWNWKSAFPFYLNEPDSLSFFRNYQASLDTVNISRIFIYSFSGGFPQEYINATFKRNVGVLRISYYYNQYINYRTTSNLILQNSVITDVKTEQSPELPKTFILDQNYPNPFNPVTTISFYIPKKSQVVISIFDILGRLVSSIYDGDISAGDHIVQWNGNGHSSGIYFCKVELDGISKFIKLVLLK
jgi:Secretion system C-terminal sorting domain